MAVIEYRDSSVIDVVRSWGLFGGPEKLIGPGSYQRRQASADCSLRTCKAVLVSMTLSLPRTPSKAEGLSKIGHQLARLSQ